MPITQDRMLALIASARYYQRTLEKVRKAVLDIINQGNLTHLQRLEFIFAEMHTLRVPDEHISTLLTEEAHFKVNHKRNDTRRRYEQRRKMLHQSVDFDTALEQSYREAHPSPVPVTRPAYFDQPEQPEHAITTNTELQAQLADDRAREQEILAEGRRQAEAIRGQEAAGELAHHPSQVLNMGANFGLAAPPPPEVHNSTNNNEARKLTPQELKEKADRNNAAGWGSEPL